MDIHQFFLNLAIILLAARLLSEIAGRRGIPPVIGELSAGLLFGPSLFGLVAPDSTLTILAEIGIIFLLFEVGMETDVFRLAKTGVKPFIVAALGFCLPMAFGYGISSWFFGMPLLPALFVGGTLTATSIGITVRVLMDLNRRNSDEAQIVIGAAVIDDILGVILLAFLYQFAIEQQVSLATVGTVSLSIALFMVIAPIVAKLLGAIIDHFDQRSVSPGLLVTMTVCTIMIFSYISHAVGAPAIMGGFAAGIAMGHQFKISLGSTLNARLPQFERLLSASPELAHRLEHQIRPLVHLFTPIFFVMVGVSLNLNTIDWSSPSIWLLAVSLTVAAILGKCAAGFFINEPRLRQIVIGIAMVPRGEVGLIFAQLGLNNQILSPELYAALLIVIAITTTLPPFALKWFYGRFGSEPTLTAS